jgi:hypothetical protein
METSKFVEAMVEPMAAEPMPATPRLPYSRACEEQRRYDDDDPHPLLPGSHSDPLPLMICVGAPSRALDRVQWPFDADLLRNRPSDTPLCWQTLEALGALRPFDNVQADLPTGSQRSEPRAQVPGISLSRRDPPPS